MLRIEDPQILIKPANQQNFQDSGSSILGLSLLDPDCKSHFYQNLLGGNDRFIRINDDIRSSFGWKLGGRS